MIPGFHGEMGGLPRAAIQVCATDKGQFSLLSQAIVQDGIYDYSLAGYGIAKSSEIWICKTDW